MDLGIKDKRALVMASSQGLGRATAEALAAEGCRLLLCARNKKALQQTAVDLHKLCQVDIYTAAADVSTASGRQQILAAAQNQLGGVDILVTNSGGPPPGPFEDHTSEDWLAAYKLTFESVLEMTQAVLPMMKVGSWGRIIAINSICVREPIAGLTLSNSIRPAVTGMLASLAAEVAADGITVNSVLSGLHNTARMAALGTNKETLANIPTGRLGEPNELAALIAFLASDQASYITGTAIPVDGGMTHSY